jgi:hypothetical protein
VEQSHALRHGRLPKSKREEALHEHWNLLNAAGHLALLSTMGGDGDRTEEIAGHDVALRSAFSFGLASSTAVRFIVQGAWATGRLGKRVLPAYKWALAEDVAFFDWLDTVFALVAIGRRTSGLRAEVAKALRAAPGMVPVSADAARLREAMRSAFENVSAVAVDRLENRGLGGGLDAVTRGDPPPGRGGPGRARSRCAPGGAAHELRRRTHGRQEGAGVVVSNCRLGSQRTRTTVLPQPYAKAWRTRWEPRMTEQLLERTLDIERAQRKPAVRAAKPGPNESCTCGSGEKYKKCCSSPVGAGR